MPRVGREAVIGVLQTNECLLPRGVLNFMADEGVKIPRYIELLDELSGVRLDGGMTLIAGDCLYADLGLTRDFDDCGFLEGV